MSKSPLHRAPYPIYPLAMSLAALRNLDVFPIEHEGQPMFCLRDPEGYVDEQVILSPQAFFVAACLDGKNDVIDIQEAFARQFRGALLMSDDILRVVRYLEERGFLESARFDEIRHRLEQTFASLRTRPPWLAGKSYEDDAPNLRRFLDNLLESEPAVDAVPAPTACLLVPHIDFSRGAAAYAKGYSALKRGPAPESAIVFGVAHQGGGTPFILTRKHFETPLGLVETDLEIVDGLAAKCDGFDPFAAEILHRTEHSIEFQAVMLAHLYGTNLRIVPILCGNIFDAAGGAVAPARAALRFLDACREIVCRHAPRICVIAGADLAHVGRRFGDNFEVTPRVLGKIESRDRQDLRSVCACEPDGFHASLMQDGNARRVCGHACIYSALKSVQGGVLPGELFHYGYAPDPLGGIVSFAAVWWAHKRPE